jgi:hypothetical protein
MADEATNGTEATKRTRTKKGEGPLVVKFLDSKNEVHERIPDNLDAIQIVTKAGTVKNYPLSVFNLTLLKALAAESIKRRFSNAVFSAKNIDTMDVVATADDIYNNLREGKLYVRAEAGPRGRSFDYDLWVDAMVRASQKKAEAGKGKPWSKKLAEDFRTKLMSYTAEERKTKLALYKKDPVVERSLLEVKADRVAKAADDFDAFANL